MEYTFELYDFTSTNELEALFEMCFSTTPRQGYFDWKYTENPAGEAIAFVAKSNQKIAAFYGVIPERYVVDGKQKIIYQSMDTMTHPDHRRKGLFVKLARLTYQYIQEKNKTLHVIGFPGETSYPGFIKKLKWATLFELRYCFVHHAMFKLKNKKSSSSDIIVREIELSQMDYSDYLSQQHTHERGIKQYIDTAFLKWRLSKVSSVEFRIFNLYEEKQLIGFVVVKMESKQRVFLHHINIRDTTHLKKGLSALLYTLFDKLKARYVFTFCAEHTQIHNQLKNLFFIKNPLEKGPFSYKTPIILYGDQRIDALDFYAPHNWYIDPIQRDY